MITNTLDFENYEIIKTARIGQHLVLKISYPSYEVQEKENKVLVFLNVSEIDVLKWRKIDPHFRNDKIKSTKEAPSPSAQFPVTLNGWEDACSYARSKTRLSRIP